jgi:hypothetical protein
MRTILISMLLLTNAVAVGMWWRSHSQAQHWQAEAKALSKRYDVASKENNSLQETIVRQKEPSLKLSALSNTVIGKCVSEHPKTAQDDCVGPERVIKGYQKILNRSERSYKVGSLLRQIIDTESIKTEQLQPLP